MKDIVAHVEITQGEQRLVVGFSDWIALRKAIDDAIEDTGWKLS